MTTFTRRLTALSAATAALTLTLATLAAQPVDTWRRLATPNDPGPRQFMSMAYDSNRAECVLFGGMDSGFNSIAGTFTFDGTTWTRRAPSTTPPRNGAYAIAYDPVRDRTVLFGGDGSGLGGGNNLGVTWLWDGTDWTRANPTNSPSPRMEPAMTFDATIGKILLFGGRVGGATQSDTWAWDGNDWQRLNPATNAPGRYAQAMAYDQAIGMTVMFGGRGPGNLDDTWLFDGSTWIDARPPRRPAARHRVGFAYDPSIRRCVMFGGFNNSQFFSDTWTFNGVRRNWQRFSPAASPGARDAHAMAYFAAKGCIVMFGGDVTGNPGRDTWEYCASGRWITLATDSGCPGTAGTPDLQALNSRPAIGTTFTLRCTNVPANAATAFLAFGLSNTDWSGIPLPFDLGPAGAPTCFVRASTEVVLTAAPTAGTADFPIPVPNVVALIGAAFFNQAWLPDPSNNALGVALSNQGTGSIGR